MSEPELLAALVRAIASDLIDLGYRATSTRGFIQQTDNSIRFVADEVWCAINEIIAGDEPGFAAAQMGG